MTAIDLIERSCSGIPHSSDLQSLMRRCGLSIAEQEFITIVSNTYHELEAPIYDRQHEEIYSQVPPMMDLLLEKILRVTGDRKLRILDMGCGTGFASQVILGRARDLIQQVVCADISPHMLGACRAKLASTPEVRFHLGDVASLQGMHDQFEIVMTCSVVHHVKDIQSFFSALLRLITPGGFYMMLHEPSRRFYRNPICNEVYERYRDAAKRRALLRLFSPSAYVRKLRRLLLGWQSFSIEHETARLLIERNIVHCHLTTREVRQLVDIHVPPIDEGSFLVGLEGFDISELRSTYLSDLNLVADHSYGFLGTFCERSAPYDWRRRARELSLEYPDDGACFSSLWQRPLDSPQRDLVPSRGR